MTAILIELSVNLPDATGSGKSKMAASKPEILVLHLLYEDMCTDVTRSELILKVSL